MKSRHYMENYRKDGFTPEELKLYWNSTQLENLCPKEGVKPSSYDPSDEDAVENLAKNPVSERNHRVKIRYVNQGIQEAVFEVPDGAQVIVLNFAVKLLIHVCFYELSLNFIE